MSEPLQLSQIELSNGRLAHKVVVANNGKVTFAEYDSLMRSIKYFTPITWIAGWGNSVVWKANNDKLCAFAACKMGLLIQTKEGYEDAQPRR